MEHDVAGRLPRRLGYAALPPLAVERAVRHHRVRHSLERLDVAAESERQPLSGRRLWAFVAALALIVAALAARLVDVQLLHGAQFEAAARANQIRQIEIAAPRGLILDRRGAVIARSRPSFVLAVIPSEVAKPERTIAKVAALIGHPSSELWRRLLHHRGINYKSFEELQVYEPYGPVILARALHPAQVARLVEASEDLPGIDVEVQAVRDYPYGSAGSHLLGHVGQITEEEYQSLKHFGYTPNDVVGKDGLETIYDRWLRGTPGGKRVVVDAQGNVVRNIGYADPKPGDSLVTSLDWRLQTYLETGMRRELQRQSKLTGRSLAGAAVAIDPNTGGVLALVSMPNYNPNDFSDGISQRNYTRYVTDPRRPLYDRAIAAATATGSTFKPLVAAAALAEHVISADAHFYDGGSYYCHGARFHGFENEALGSINMYQAIAASDDVYFYHLGDLLGHARLRDYALQFGLDAKSGIDLPGEYEGNWPTNAWMMKVYGLPLEPSDACILAIGQGAMEATPIQMANAVAAIANGGTLWRPHIVTSIRNWQGKTVKVIAPAAIRRITVPPQEFAVVRKGMSLVTGAGGTAFGLTIPGLPYGGKTGTVETDGGHGPNTTWFEAFAPVDHPKIAIAVYMERTGGYGATIAAPVAAYALAKYFGKKPPALAASGE
ncbi:penicillin-binding protein 2 [bacterium]|nr:MAG: penicillin-binding protein 2 [bacterium]